MRGMMSHHTWNAAWMLFLSLCVGGVSALRVDGAPQAVNDVQVTVSGKVCDWAINPASYVISAQNTNTGKDVIATLKYESVPPGQSFPFLDSQIQAYTDSFPKSLEVRIPAGATVPVGCKYTYRNEVVSIEVVVTVAGAVYANPGTKPPVPNPLTFTGFASGVFPECPHGKLLAIANLHPFLWLSADVHMSNGYVEHQDVEPYALRRAGCDNNSDAPYPVRVTNAKLVQRGDARAIPEKQDTSSPNPFAQPKLR
jgi:hypothetical protein